MNGSSHRIYVIVWMLFCANIELLARELGLSSNDQTSKTVQLGNLSLPTSQQPGPLIGFGQNIVDQGDFQLFGYVDLLKGNARQIVGVVPAVLYGLKDNVSLFIELPIAANIEFNNQDFAGLQNLLMQIEYAFYNKDTQTTADQMTFVANVSLPTSTLSKNNVAGFGHFKQFNNFSTPSYFLGFTASHMGIDWYPFVSVGTVITTSDQNNKSGNQFYYQCGLSKNIKYVAKRWILNGMIEFDGIYKQRNKIVGKVDQNSGGNTMLLGPSVWFSTQRIILQAGISWVLPQQLFGQQSTDLYYVSLNFGWKF